MAVKGAQLKQEITKKILTTFPGSFLYNDGKEIRINGTEAGLPVQIKVTLTAAKEPVENDNIVIASNEAQPIKIEFENKPSVIEKIPDEPTEEEKANLKMLLEGLGF